MPALKPEVRARMSIRRKISDDTIVQSTIAVANGDGEFTPTNVAKHVCDTLKLPAGTVDGEFVTKRLAANDTYPQWEGVDGASARSKTADPKGISALNAALKKRTSK